MQEEVILVDELDIPIGKMEKIEAHQKGILHRAFSVFIFNSNGDLLLQQRALHKYHSAGLWTNTCCSHPRPNEDTLAAANRRLKEEMGITAKLEHKTQFIYKTVFDNNLTEHEFDHVFFGNNNQTPEINPVEVENYAWVSTEKIMADIAENPSKYTSWFKIAMEKLF
ncbi:MAG: isopentenyl-diphosphate Delta-isomerase [Bacteroidetes bacterium]|nr:isopentenyl-diphosphate Delta-isomerase [Bacteroidota bacterium]